MPIPNYFTLEEPLHKELYRFYCDATQKEVDRLWRENRNIPANVLMLVTRRMYKAENEVGRHEPNWKYAKARYEALCYSLEELVTLDTLDHLAVD